MQFSVSSITLQLGLVNTLQESCVHATCTLVTFFFLNNIIHNFFCLLVIWDYVLFLLVNTINCFKSLSGDTVVEEKFEQKGKHLYCLIVE